MPLGMQRWSLELLPGMADADPLGKQQPILCLSWARRGAQAAAAMVPEFASGARLQPLAAAMTAEPLPKQPLQETRTVASGDYPQWGFLHNHLCPVHGDKKCCLSWRAETMAAAHAALALVPPSLSQLCCPALWSRGCCPALWSRGCCCSCCAPAMGEGTPRFATCGMMGPGKWLHFLHPCNAAVVGDGPAA